MADLSDNRWNENDELNTASPPNGYPVSSQPSTLPNTIRNIRGAMKRWWDRSNAQITSTGDGSAYTLTYPISPVGYVTGENYTWIANANNTTTTPTIRINSLDAKSLVQSDGSNFQIGDIKTSMFVSMAYDGTKFRVTNFRSVVDGNKIWHQGNDGAGSGLDADLLDGNDSSYYTNIPARLGYTPVNVNGSADVTISKTYPQIRLKYTNVGQWGMYTNVSGQYILQYTPEGGSASNPLVFGTDGSILSAQFGDLKTAITSATPAGAIMAFARNSAPDGWLKANGAAISRTTYANLFAAISTTFGTGDGSTTFNLPDLRGEFVRGIDEGRGADSGRVFGANQGSANASHNHRVYGNTAGAGNHNHHASVYRSNGNASGGGAFGALTDADSRWDAWTDAAGDHGHWFDVWSEASGTNESRPRNVALLYCIKY